MDNSRSGVSFLITTSSSRVGGFGTARKTVVLVRGDKASSFNCETSLSNGVRCGCAVRCVRNTCCIKFSFRTAKRGPGRRITTSKCCDS